MLCEDGLLRGAQPLPVRRCVAEGRADARQRERGCGDCAGGGEVALSRARSGELPADRTCIERGFVYPGRSGVFLNIHRPGVPRSCGCDVMPDCSLFVEPAGAGQLPTRAAAGQRWRSGSFRCQQSLSELSTMIQARYPNNSIFY